MAARSSASLAAAAGTSTRAGASAPRRFSMTETMVSKILLRAYHFEVASTMVHGANSDSVSSSISSVAARYSSYFLWRAQPGLERIGFDGAEPFLLLLPGDVQEELQDGGAVGGQRALELDDVAIGVAPRLLRDGALDPLVQDANIPTAIIDDHLTAVGDFQPEAPQPGALLLVGARSGDGIELETARVQPLGQGRDGRALARGVPALEHDHGRDAVVPARLLEIVQALLNGGQGQFVLLARQLPLEVDILQHGFSSILDDRPPTQSPLARGLRFRNNTARTPRFSMIHHRREP